MDINQLRLVVNSISPEHLQEFSSEASFRFGVNKLLGKPVQKHLLAAAQRLVDDRMILLGIRPIARKQPRPETVIHDIDRRQKPSGHNGRTKVTKVSPEEMEKLWKKIRVINGS